MPFLLQILAPILVVMSMGLQKSMKEPKVPKNKKSSRTNEMNSTYGADASVVVQ